MERKLHPGEADNLNSVFRGAISEDEVRIANDLSIFNRPWTSAPGFGKNYYTIHAGMTNFSWTLAGTNLLVHELTHVWQGKYAGAYWLYTDSVLHQCLGYLNGENAYLVDQPDQQWSDYNAEQQAAIIAGWFTSGRRLDDWRYRYLAKNIWARNPSALSSPVDTEAVALMLLGTTNSIRNLRA